MNYFSIIGCNRLWLLPTGPDAVACRRKDLAPGAGPGDIKLKFLRASCGPLGVPGTSPQKSHEIRRAGAKFGSRFTTVACTFR